ncbi:hypothetical protein [Streptomyces sp. SID12501]|uniref:Uncharacterized protein n=1 Tax=Streptomyces sp. SID12501 TaxID=2706042 RepID=A0A6B3C2E6_9ACTN|nr:hypothetical protein [Streptomyces sp. SID12501]NEC90480.1 hypothetical protein [Streptomyces sp. SID12501]
MQFPTFLAGQTLTAALLNSIPPVLKYKAAGTDRATATLSDDPDLTFAVEANAVYEMRGVLRVNTTDATNGDFNLSWTVPSGAQGLWSGIGQPATATATDGTVRTMGSTISASRAYGAIISGGNELAIVVHSLLVTSSAGTYAVNWARSGSAGTVSLMAFSYLTLTRVG